MLPVLIACYRDRICTVWVCIVHAKANREKTCTLRHEKKNDEFYTHTFDSDFEILLSTEVHLMNSYMIFLNADDTQA